MYWNVLDIFVVSFNLVEVITEACWRTPRPVPRGMGKFKYGAYCDGTLEWWVVRATIPRKPCLGLVKHYDLPRWLNDSLTTSNRCQTVGHLENRRETSSNYHPGNTCQKNNIIETARKEAKCIGKNRRAWLRWETMETALDRNIRNGMHWRMAIGGWGFQYLQAVTCAAPVFPEGLFAGFPWLLVKRCYTSRYVTGMAAEVQVGIGW